MKNKESTPFGTGMSSLLMIFVVLCLTVFGVLAYMTARADDRLTQRSAEMVQAYYQADAAAEEALAQLDAALLELEPEAALESAGFTVDGGPETWNGSLEISIQDTRVYQLQVVVEQGSYRVTARQTVDHAVWEEEYLDVWDGQ